MRCNHPGFEPRSLIPFLRIIMIFLYIYIYIYIYIYMYIYIYIYMYSGHPKSTTGICNPILPASWLSEQ